MIIKSNRNRKFKNTENTKIFILYPDITTDKALVHLCSFLMNPINFECIQFAIYYSIRQKIDQFTKQMKFLFL